MIDEKTLPAGPPPAYPEQSQPQLQSQGSSYPQSTTTQQPSAPGFPQPASDSYFPPHNMGSPPQAQPGQEYSSGYPYPQPKPSAQSARGPSGRGPQPQFPPGSMQQMQMDAQIGAQYQQQLYAKCARGDHDVVTKFGVCGIITAVILFPIGLVCLFFSLDTDKKCARCGAIVG
ncbi:unnamed protein product [Somion occarium]|uniref:Brain protein I3 n=1 Tax=Somion occarium TaxID=3059160 RepID=A0ABP1DXZ1_9APHY